MNKKLKEDVTDTAQNYWNLERKSDENERERKKKSKTVQQEIDFTEIEKLNFLLNGESRMLFMPHIKYKCYAW